MRTTSGPILSFEAAAALEKVGADIRTARLRRGESEQQAAIRAGVSRSTWRRLEAGDSTVSAGLLFEALSLYGFGRDLFELADPDSDEEGKARDAVRRPKKGRSQKW